MVFDNSVEKIWFLNEMKRFGVMPECECFDTGIVRSVAMFEQVGLLSRPVHVSLVIGVASGMPARADWLPLLVDELNPGVEWQTIAIGRQEVWDVHARTAELGGQLRTGSRTPSTCLPGSAPRATAPLIEALASSRDRGRRPASPAEARVLLGLADADALAWSPDLTSTSARRGSGQPAPPTWRASRRSGPLARARAGGGEKHVERHQARGGCCRGSVELLVDREGTSWRSAPWPVWTPAAASKPGPASWRGSGSSPASSA
ncbi:MAG: 3-keto-5-aminohexanoate cleavage protein [bacterium]